MAPPENGNALQARIKSICDEFSLSEVARRTGTPVSSVHRYVTGARVPAEFCGALVKTLGVNPAWLLVGEGSRMLADVPVRTAAVADGMLEMVEAMNAVEQMRLGSLTGSKHRKTLRDLNDALQRHDNLRLRLETKIAPVAGELLSMLFQAADRRELTRARELHKGLSQIMRFSDELELRRRYLQGSAHLEYVSGKYEASAEFQRQSLLLILADTESSVDSILSEANNFSLVLSAMGRAIEATAILRAALAICDAREPRKPRSYQTLALLAQGLINIGDGPEGVQTAAQAMANLPESDLLRIGKSMGMLMRYAIDGSPPTVVMPWHSEHPSSRSTHLIAALHTEDEAELRFVLDEIKAGAKELNVAERFLVGQAKYVLNYCRKRGVRKVEQPPTQDLDLSPTDQVSLCAYAAARDRLRGDLKSARVHLHEGMQYRAALPRHSCVPVLVLCLLLRETALAMPNEPEGAQALAELNELAAKGYGCTRWAFRLINRAQG